MRPDIFLTFVNVKNIMYQVSILAIIAGSAINHDGRSNGMLAPNPDAQAEVLRKAYKDAGVNPRTVDYIEAHGTGTQAGDPVEAAAIGEVLSGAGGGRAGALPVGSVKTNIGHLETASGMAGLIKVLLMFRHRVIPPNLHFDEPNPRIDFDDGITGLIRNKAQN